MDITKEFVIHEGKMFRFQLGKRIASSLSGFIAGVIAASIVWVLALYFFNI